MIVTIVYLVSAHVIRSRIPFLSLSSFVTLFVAKWDNHVDERWENKGTRTLALNNRKKLSSLFFVARLRGEKDLAK